MMTNPQFNIAFEILTAYYGMPAWESNPKQGQSKEEIINVWCKELKYYTVEQVRTACAWLTRKKKTMTFPTIHIVMCELMGQNPMPSVNKHAEAVYCYASILNYDNRISKQAAGRAIYRLFGIALDGYHHETDTGY